MNPIFIMYMLATATAICAGAPQLRKLMITKQSDEFSLTTWIIWLVAQTVSLIYALTVKDRLYALVCVLWVAFYVVMVGLIVKYRTPKPVEEKELL